VQAGNKHGRLRGVGAGGEGSRRNCDVEAARERWGHKEAPKLQRAARHWGLLPSQARLIGPSRARWGRARSTAQPARKTPQFKGKHAAACLPQKRSSQAKISQAKISHATQQQVVSAGHSLLLSHSTGFGGPGLGPGFGPGPGLGLGAGGGLGPVLRGYEGWEAMPQSPALPRPMRILM
jgi:hypothetical protein